jgi:DNA-directed RNA polymerase specialized sigma24 family protein
MNNAEALSLRRYLLSQCHEDMIDHCDVEDLVHETIARLLASPSFSNIELGANSSKFFAFRAMARLASNRARDLRRRAMARLDLISSHESYQRDCSREIELEGLISKLEADELEVMSMLADGAQTKDLVNKNDRSRVRKKLGRLIGC